MFQALFFPNYERSDHATKRRKVSELQGPDAISPLDAGINKNIAPATPLLFFSPSPSFPKHTKHDDEK
jgi:hypothetical protein